MNGFWNMMQLNLIYNMKHLKTFESENIKFKIIKNFANYIIDKSKLEIYNDGFMNYSIQNYSTNSVYYTYYFKFDLEMFGDYEIGINKLKNFLKTIKVENIKRRKYRPDKIEISFDVECNIAKEISELYNSTNKYNL